eukprot:15360541-Ditylum_brightwellii.AAC.1
MYTSSNDNRIDGVSKPFTSALRSVKYSSYVSILFDVYIGAVITQEKWNTGTAQATGRIVDLSATTLTHQLGNKSMASRRGQPDSSDRSYDRSTVRRSPGGNESPPVYSDN